MADVEMVRLGYNEGPPSIEIGGTHPVALVRGQKSKPVPLTVAAHLLAFPPKSYKPEIYPDDKSKLDTGKLRAEVERIKEERKKLSAYQKLEITIKLEDWKRVYAATKDEDNLARALKAPVRHVRAFAQMNGYELDPPKKLEAGFGAADLDVPESEPTKQKPVKVKEGGDK